MEKPQSQAWLMVGWPGLTGISEFDFGLVLARLGLGMVFLKQNEFRRAVAEYEAAVRVEPRLAEGGHMLGDYFTLVETSLRCGAAGGSSVLA